MESFEEAFDSAARVTDLALKANQDLLKQLRRLRKASLDGNITAVKREQGRLVEALDRVAEAVNDAGVAWAFGDEEEVQYLRDVDGYAAELRRVASEKGLLIRERDGQLICHPFIVRIIPGERAVRIDKKKVSAIRPSHLTDVLVKAQKSPPRYRPQAFLESMYKVYLSLTKESSARLIGGTGAPVILLADVYRQFTSLPGSSRDYTGTDFARDLYELDRSGVTTTRSGAIVSFPASTGARSSRNLYTFVGPDGYEVKYYGIRFKGS
jgi:hypothetical protein